MATPTSAAGTPCPSDAVHVGDMTTKLEAAEAAFPEGPHSTREVVLAFREAFMNGCDAALAASTQDAKSAYRVVHSSASILEGHVKVGDLVRSRYGGTKAAVWEVLEVDVAGFPTYGYKHGFHRIRSVTSGRTDLRAGADLRIVERVKP